MKILAFTCNWSAYSAIETAGLNRSEYPPAVRLVRVPCLIRLNTGLVLRAFELGADGVLLLGCPPESCHFGLGAKQAREVLEQSRKMLVLLGIDRQRLSYIELPAGRGDIFISKTWDFWRTLSKSRSGRPENHVSKVEETAF